MPVGADASFVEEVRAALRTSSTDGVAIDFGQIVYLDPAGIGVLRTIADEADALGTPIVLEHVRPPVYKALHLAKLAARFRRAS